MFQPVVARASQLRISAASGRRTSGSTASGRSGGAGNASHEFRNGPNPVPLWPRESSFPPTSDQTPRAAAAAARCQALPAPGSTRSILPRRSTRCAPRSKYADAPAGHFSLPPEYRPFHFPDFGPTLGVLDAVTLPLPVAECRANSAPGSALHSTGDAAPAADTFSCGPTTRPASTEHARFDHPAVEVRRHFAYEDLADALAGRPERPCRDRSLRRMSRPGHARRGPRRGRSTPGRSAAWCGTRPRRGCSFFSTLGIIDPLLGQVDFTVQQTLKAGGGIAEMHGDNAIVYLAATTQPLPGGADGLVAALGACRIRQGSRWPAGARVRGRPAAGSRPAHAAHPT